jgi:hypothetical protein
MLARNPLLPPVVQFDPSLAVRLDDVLFALPSVISVALDPAIESLLRPLRLPALDLVCREVRFDDGSRLTVVAVPEIHWSRRATKLGLVSLRRAAAAIGRDVLPIPEFGLDPHGSSSMSEGWQSEAEYPALVAGRSR